MTYEEKKDYLRGYKFAKHNVREAEIAIEELRAAQIMASKDNNGMPTGKGGVTDLSNYIVRLEELEARRSEAIKKQMIEVALLEQAISTLTDSRERMILCLRYMKNWKWESIADEMGYDERWVRKLHTRAINNLDL